MKQVDVAKYQEFVGGAGFVRKVDYELMDKASIIYVDHNNVTWARANYYADERPATYWIRERSDG